MALFGKNRNTDKNRGDKDEKAPEQRANERPVPADPGKAPDPAEAETAKPEPAAIPEEPKSAPSAEADYTQTHGFAFYAHSHFI